MTQPSVETFLADLGSARPTPGGGAAAALMAATGAALVEMVANLTIGRPAYAEHEALMIRARDRAAALRVDASGLAAADERAFDAVIAAYRIPRDDPGRPDAIQHATAAAARPPMRIAALSAAVIALAGEILPVANVNVRSDVSVAASAARAALESAIVNVEINVAALHDRDQAGALIDELGTHVTATAEAEKIIATVRAGLTR